MARAYIGGRGQAATKSTSFVDVEEYTIDEALETFILSKEAEGVRSRTIEEYRHYKRYLKMFLEEYQYKVNLINGLSAKIICEYIIYLKQTKKAYEGIANREKESAGLSVNTSNIRLRTLKTMCNFGFKEGIIQTNPVSNIKLVRDDEQKEVQGLNDEVLNKLLSQFDTREYAQWRDKVLILLLLDTGMRINKAVNLQVSHIDLKLLTIHIPSETAKNRKGRDVSITREVGKLLQELHMEISNYFGDCEYVFFNAYGEPFTADAFRRRLNRKNDKMG
ncbi:tyrosine-type recombinase/integrase [Peribacillus kribbensis]|uniref:tyrosine-type recombinase/integrase n=1 Tax=Peribacillus kribbensis TaxID=356658 RepID=UPI0003F666CC|nr:tyrosine-type recombinase/integrase [Peribacillus kribbensis]